ncbi:MAG: hypothetical protein H6810_00425 [Phycisphaeraceae bacterium]|nr:MAG: hypothetical protein H6810_00425 [Phycisphaeraceae bacterium]
MWNDMINALNSRRAGGGSAAHRMSEAQQASFQNRFDARSAWRNRNTFATDLQVKQTQAGGLNKVNGGRGNDSIHGGYGNDSVHGGYGNDNVRGRYARTRFGS